MKIFETPEALSAAYERAGLRTPDLSAPTLIGKGGLRYKVGLILNQVWPDGQWANDANLNMNADNEGHPLDIFGAAASALAWVDIVATPEITIQHAEVEGHPYLVGHIETLYGRPVPTGPSQYVVDRNEDEIVFLTEQEILDEGQLRPTMEKWVGALLARGYNRGISRKFGRLL